MSYSDKINRNYKLFIEATPQNSFLPTVKNALEISYPLTIQFDIERSISSSLNQAQLRVYNLGLKTYSQIVQDRFNIQDFGNGQLYRRIVFQAGYSELSTVFKGNLIQAYTFREGVNMITYMQIQDGGYGAYNGYTNVAFDRGIPFKEMVQTLFRDMPKVTEGKIGAIDGEAKRGTVFNGNTYTLLKNNFNQQIFIDLEKINLINPNEVFAGQVPLISAETGLLGTPRRENTYIVVNMIFEPRIILGQIVEMKSVTDPRFNGQYKVYGIRHNGIISGAVDGGAITTLQLDAGTQILGGLKTL